MGMKQKEGTNLWKNGSLENHSPPIYHRWLRMSLVLKLLMIGTVRLPYSPNLVQFSADDHLWEWDTGSLV